MNYYKQQQRAFTIARNYERSLGRAEGAPLMLRTMAAPTKDRIVGIVQTIDVNAPKRKLVKSGARMVRRVSFK
jgi:hypothetical protein